MMWPPYGTHWAWVVAAACMAALWVVMVAAFARMSQHHVGGRFTRPPPRRPPRPWLTRSSRDI